MYFLWHYAINEMHFKLLINAYLNNFFIDDEQNYGANANGKSYKICLVYPFKQISPSLKQNFQISFNNSVDKVDPRKKIERL